MGGSARLLGTRTAVRSYGTPLQFRGYMPRTGRGRGGKGSGGDKNDDECHPDRSEAEEFLRQEGYSIKSLPEDMQVALREGRMTKLDATRWLSLSTMPLFGALAVALPAFRDRMLGSPRFLFTLGLEEAIGCTAKMIAEVGSRGESFMAELDFVFSDIMLEIIGDFSLVWLLAPRRFFGPLPTTASAKILHSLPSHCLQIGNYAVWQRAATVAKSREPRGLHRHVVCTGSHVVCTGSHVVCAGVACVVDPLVGHGATVALVSMRPKQEGAKELAPVWQNSFTWASFMVISSNLRYQLVNSIEERGLEKFVPAGIVRNSTQFVLRFGNCFAGGLQWVWFARMAGLQ
ncbi:hypothetical protein CYMTET_7092 [Cymbomonas tetramitiformis]|uniref:Uncharacterized protein n=1 Tax=Cymbomonas tetramitiformis TaxID=36881 RepID=A0AAE0LHE9_9CHLO|nr:hypothetical protein CYMTET_7092 [Cymbomonas tetramitiformis]